MATVVIGTAGHIDHGKTSLLRALTGIDADRLPEERARGMTIDVGYAHLAFDDGVELDFVDVPGHDRLIGNMLVGAGEIDGAMLVVAADDGPRPQTIEHLQLLDALEINAGLAVVTKADIADPDRVAQVVTEVEALLAATSLAGSPVLAASSTTGGGLEQLRIALRALSDRVVAERSSATEAGKGGPARFAIDRAFAAKGRGVVVTGTLRGSIVPGAWLRREPGGELVRVRELQVHSEPRPSFAGGRVAFNVTGAVTGQLRRGDVLSGGERGSTGVLGVDRLLVRLRAPAPLGPTPGRPVGSRSNLRLHIGTAQVDAALRRLPGADSLAELKLAERIATFSGDRGVLRQPASGDVVAGIRVLDLAPLRGASRKRLTPGRLEALSVAIDAADPALVEAARLDLHGALVADDARSVRSATRSFLFADDVRASLEAAALALVTAHHRQAPVSAGLPLPRARTALLRHLRSIATVDRRAAEPVAAAVARLLDELVAAGRLARDGDALRDPARGGGRPPELSAAMDRLEAALAVPAPPPLDVAAAAAGCPAEGVRALAAEGRIVRLGPDLAWATTTYHDLAAIALEQARIAPLTPAAYRDATGTSRKFVMTLLEDFDRRDILRRTPEGHVPGPRAPRRSGSA